MEKNNLYHIYDKVKKVIKSCETTPQLKVAVRMYNKFVDSYGDEIESHYLKILKELIGLMKIKCMDEEVNEVSNIGKEFRKAASMSRVKK